MRKILVADTEEKKIGNEFGLFPTESKDGVSLEKKEILQLSEALSYIYAEIIENVSLKFSNENLIDQKATRVICRRALVPILHCLFERLIRINKAVNFYSVKKFRNKKSLFLTPNTIEDFEVKITTEEFNDFIILYLSSIWELEKTKKNEVRKNIDTKKIKFKNHLFLISNHLRFISKFMYILSRLIKWIPAFGRFPVLNFANAERYFDLRGFHFKHFKRIDNKWQLNQTNFNESQRKSFFNIDLVKTKSVLKFLKEVSFSPKQTDLISELLIKFIANSFPLQFIENLNNNYAKSEKLLIPFSSKHLIASSFSDTRSILIIAAAKAMKFNIVGVQHGGHYGYYKDSSPTLENEWPYLDQFLTWGWKKLPSHLALKSMDTSILPSPWLSERREFFKDIKVGGDKLFDVIWMPQMMKLHSSSPRGSSSIRLDVIQEFSEDMINFASLASIEKIKIYCKPYNYVTTFLMKKTYQQLSDIGGSNFQYANNFDKGLSHELINKGHLFFWDQPGTGFLECLACGIPTMVLWTRLFCEEVDWCRKDFRELKKVGVIHRTPENLIKELKIFLKDPALWMNNPYRKVIVNKFTNKYALTNDKWSLVWRDYLRKLKEEVSEKQ